MAHLAGAIDAGGRGRDHLAKPVGRQLEERDTGDLRHPFAAPAGQVRHDDVEAEVKLRLVEDDPSARAAFLPPERSG